jgi:hypothetical protein
MKLYTEEQVMKFINDNFDEGCSELVGLTPIELPTDEEIKVYALCISENPKKNEGSWITYKAAIEGAKWVINKLKGGEK